MARVAALPRSYRLTDAEWRVLVVLACDSYDGQTTAPGLDNLAAWSGLLRSTVAAALARLCDPTPDRPALLTRAYSTRGRNRTEWRLLLPEPEPSGHAGRMGEATTVHEPSMDRPAEPDGKPSTNRPVTPDTPLFPNHPSPPAARAAPGGWPIHEHDANARAALRTLIRDCRLPLDEDELLSHAYRLGGGDPWAGYLAIKPELQRSLDGANDAVRVLRSRLANAGRAA